MAVPRPSPRLADHRQTGRGHHHITTEPPYEQGFTLVELAVAMLIMTIFFSLVMSGMIHLVSPAMQTEALGSSTSQIDLAFMNMDQEVRYAANIWEGADANGNPYMDFETAFNNKCTQIEFQKSAGNLVQREWPYTGSVPTGSAPSWKILATGLVPDPTNPSQSPFQEPGNNYPKQQVTVNIYTASGTGSAHTVSYSSVTFTALDSTGTAAANGCAPDPSWS